MSEKVLYSRLNEDLAQICEAGFHRMGPAQALRRGKFANYCLDQQQGKLSVFVAHTERDYIGHAALVWATDYPHFARLDIPEIQDLNVLPDYRNRGVGTTIVTMCENEAFLRVSTVGIGVGLHPGYNNAQRLYPKLGYIPDGNGVHYGTVPVKEGNSYLFDDDLALFFTKSRDS